VVAGPSQTTVAQRSCSNFEASTRVLLGHGTAGHGDQLWAWFSICNGSMSSAHELCAVADGKQLYMASWKMLHLAACVGL
jgi:hypothetical protein